MFSRTSADGYVRWSPGHLKKGRLFNASCWSSVDRLNIGTVRHLYWAGKCEHRGCSSVGMNVMVTAWRET